jgi:hypothetical protein
MALTKMKSEEVTFPLSVFETADTKEDLEDWLLSQNYDFIKKMRKARREDISGKGRSWTSLKRELCIK